MAESNALDILKGAILLEHRGRALYESVAESKAAEPVKELFRLLAHEEETHIEILNRQFAGVVGGQGFSLPDPDSHSEETVYPALTEKVIAGITAAGYEAAVISAALDFEKNAVAYYADRARSSDDKRERDLYQWLADWETTHMNMLAKMDNQLREEIWFDNQFWPLD